MSIDKVFIAAMLLVLGGFIAAVVGAVRAPSISTIAIPVIGLGLLPLLVKIRFYAFVVQDRIIRLEMRLRMKEILDAELYNEAVEKLTLPQIIGLRFSCDEQLPELIREALKENLPQGEIKKRVKVWQPDFVRV
jgi:hypothetical protein